MRLSHTTKTKKVTLLKIKFYRFPVNKLLNIILLQRSTISYNIHDKLKLIDLNLSKLMYKYLKYYKFSVDKTLKIIWFKPVHFMCDINLTNKKFL